MENMDTKIQKEWNPIEIIIFGCLIEFFKIVIDSKPSEVFQQISRKNYWDQLQIWSWHRKKYYKWNKETYGGTQQSFKSMAQCLLSKTNRRKLKMIVEDKRLNKVLTLF
jgi:hypothetical protein